MRTHPCERIDPADVRVRKSGQQSATIHSPCWIRANDFVLLDIGGHVSDWGLLISRSARYSSTFLNLAMCGSGSFEKVSMQPGQHRLTMMPLWLTRANPPPRSTFLPQTMQLGASF